ncbi:hypothetical protein B0A48_11027 [Cryoendolithus antarcticus]|uniref:RRM domain-containing protein n=1 Tax=Cryoendolithus antarcticus TaxID=1507870 RepID=A0A1V8SZ19_9PEZI|nr:hypothetical protein B0A48_11027 [Cryoendolithus antarcticus]
MATKTKDAQVTKEKRQKSSKDDKVTKSKKPKVVKSERIEKAAKATPFSLLADDKTVNPALSSLFVSKPLPPRPQLQAPAPKAEVRTVIETEADEELSEGDEELDDEADVDDETAEPTTEPVADVAPVAPESSKRKRKRKDADDDLEDVYMRKLETEEAKDAKQAAAERAAKRQKPAVAEMTGATVDEDEEIEDGDVEIDVDSGSDIEEPKGKDVDDDVASPPPRHETQQSEEDAASKANRTVFLGNVSTTAFTSKPARKTLIAHLKSFFPKLKEAKTAEAAPKLVSIRFRSTAFNTALPKKAAYAKKELMATTTTSTNAYAVYNSPALAREGARHLNATSILDRHLRVDEVAHPAKIDHKRCVFVGNLHFVSDESAIQAANAEDGREHRKPGKEPADVEEGLWRAMGRHGKVESVRVIRDSATRVGKGIAYVQFVDENSVEAALGDEGKKFPPMLPRRLRVQRAKAVKRNAKMGSGRPGAPRQEGKSGYQRKITAEEASQMGRTGKLFGKAAAGMMGKQGGEPFATGANGDVMGDRGSARRVAIGGVTARSIRAPESFIFEGHRATIKQGTKGLKLGGKGKGGGGAKKGAGKKASKPTGRAAKRTAAFKAGGNKKGKAS